MVDNPWILPQAVYAGVNYDEDYAKMACSGPENLDELPPIVPQFFVPPLEDKPQNPIMDSLKLENANLNLPRRTITFAAKASSVYISKARSVHREAPAPEDHSREVQELWQGALRRESGRQNLLLSWDRLRSTHPSLSSPTAFISEQSPGTYMSAKHYVQPRLFNPNCRIVHTTEPELLASLKNTVLGISSRLHVWDVHSERFIPAVACSEPGVVVVLLVDRKDEVVSSSVVQRFLRIGTLLRRLECLLSSLRTRSAKEGPTIHALAHSLSATLDYIRNALVECPPAADQLAEGDVLPLTGIWCEYAPFEELLIALAELFGRAEELMPGAYIHLESQAPPLLSRIYDHLSLQCERQSAILVRSVFAYILSSASQEYIQDVGLSIGFGGKPKELQKPRNEANHDDLAVDDDESEEEDIFDLMDEIDAGGSFPTFFPPRVLDLLPAAQKSLALLRIARPDHSLLAGSANGPPVQWLWTESAVDSRWNGVVPNSPLPSFGTSEQMPPAQAHSGMSYRPELDGFGLFDLEPGSIPKPQRARPSKSSASTDLRSFIRDFPPRLPSITPTLSSLTLLTFRDLMNHASTLSSELLFQFVGRPGKLNFKTHLELLRSFILLGKPGFKNRLLNALFDDGEFGSSAEGRGLTAHIMSVRALRKRTLRMRDPTLQAENQLRESKHPWAVGLAPHLLERETWPPVGGDLSFFLRTVIVDSLDDRRQFLEGPYGREVHLIEEDELVKEAEWRLGFAIKDLPEKVNKGNERAKWLDPLAIEALDFLYMDYKPPKPLEILISPDILSKYQRMFTFLLRLLRVECALKSLFRISTHRILSDVLFPTLTKLRQLLLHFRFVSHAFICALSGYVIDTAIGGNFDPFLDRLTTSPPHSAPSTHPGLAFSNVFELAQAHSSLLDDVLSACLLRSGQRGVGEVMRSSMEIVLQFSIVVGELHRQRIKEYEAAPLIENLYGQFCTKMTTLTQALKGIADKSLSPSKLTPDAAVGQRRPTGGLDALYHLLVRLDLTDWWSKRRNRST